MLVFAYAQRINSRRDVLLSSGKNILGDHPFHFFLLARTHLTDLGNSFFFFVLQFARNNSFSLAWQMKRLAQYCFRKGTKWIVTNVNK